MLAYWGLLLCRSQTTKGIWLAKCADIEPCTLVMDLEGTDGRERGEVPFQARFHFVIFSATYYRKDKNHLTYIYYALRFFLLIGSYISFYLKFQKYNIDHSV